MLYFTYKFIKKTYYGNEVRFKNSKQVSKVEYLMDDQSIWHFILYKNDIQCYFKLWVFVSHRRSSSLVGLGLMEVISGAVCYLHTRFHSILCSFCLRILLFFLCFFDSKRVSFIDDSLNLFDFVVSHHLFVKHLFFLFLDLLNEMIRISVILSSGTHIQVLLYFRVSLINLISDKFVILAKIEENVFLTTVFCLRSYQSELIIKCSFKILYFVEQFCGYCEDKYIRVLERIGFFVNKGLE